MVSLVDLPLVVSENIFSYIVNISQSCSQGKNWAAHLPYLQICRAWRTLLVPKVYSFGYVFQRGNTEDSLMTNMDLIDENSMKQYIKTIHLSLFYYTYFAEALKKYKSILIDPQLTLRGVTTLYVELLQTVNVPNQIEYRDQMMDVDSVLEQFAERVVTNMPNIASLDMNILRKGNYYVNSKFLNSYSKQLRRFTGQFVNMANDSNYFANITSLMLTFEKGATSRLPKINHHAIQYLRLVNIPHSFKWGDMVDGPTTSTLIFSSLTRMHLEFQTETSAEQLLDVFALDDSCLSSGICYRIEFPKLARLDIINNPLWSMLATSYVFSDSLERVKIKDSIDALQIIQNVNVHSLDYLTLWYNTLGKINEAEFYEWSNQLLSFNKRDKQRFHVNIRAINFQIDWKYTKWIGLTDINLGKINVNEFISVLSYCQSLVSLYISKFSLNVAYERVVKMVDHAIGGTDDKYSQLLNTKIIDCSFTNIDSEICSFEETQMFMNHLVTKFSHLRIICIAREFKAGVVSYASENKHLYPHLEKLRVH